MQPKDFVEVLEAAALESVSILHQYNLSRDQDREGIFAFFEGDEDKMLFIHHIRKNSRGRTIYAFVCDGKDGVLDIFDEVKQEDTKKLFFIDRDYDDYFNGKNSRDESIFVTKWYSAENYLATVETIEILWDTFIPVPKNNTYKVFVDDFSQKIDELKDALLPITAWILARRDSGDKLYLSKLKIDRLIEIGAKCTPIRSLSAFEELKRCCVEKPGKKKLHYWRKIIEKKDFLEWARGKFVIWFLHTYLYARLEEIRNSIPRGRHKLNIPVGISQKKLFETLGARLSCPSDLDNYLSIFLN